MQLPKALQQSLIQQLETYKLERFRSLRAVTNQHKEGCADAVITALQSNNMRDILVTLCEKLIADRAFEGGEHLGGLTDLLRKQFSICLGTAFEQTSDADVTAIQAAYDTTQRLLQQYTSSFSSAHIELELQARGIRAKLEEHATTSPALFNLFCTIRLARSEGLFHLRTVLEALSKQALASQLPEGFTEEMLDEKIRVYNTKLSTVGTGFFRENPLPLISQLATSDAAVVGTPDSQPLSRLSRSSSGS